MIPFSDYKAATNAAYKLISELDQFSLATNVFLIAEQLDNCRVFTYSQTSYLYGIPFDELFAVSEYGFSIKNGDKRIIYYNEKKALACIRFTLAHEIGHAVLNHQNEDDLGAEREANCFARNLLCPLPIATALEAKTEDDYVSVFNVSNQMARITIDYRRSDAYYIEKPYYETLGDKLYAYNMGFESFSAFERYVYA